MLSFFASARIRGPFARSKNRGFRFSSVYGENWSCFVSTHFEGIKPTKEHFWEAHEYEKATWTLKIAQRAFTEMQATLMSYSVLLWSLVFEH